MKKRVRRAKLETASKTEKNRQKAMGGDGATISSKDPNQGKIFFSADWLVGDERWGPPTQSTFKLNSIDLYLCFVNWLINQFDLSSSYGMIKAPREKNGTSFEWMVSVSQRDLCLWPITIKGRWSWWWSLSWRRHVGCWRIMSHLFQNISTGFSLKFKPHHSKLLYCLSILLNFSPNKTWAQH